MSSQRPFCNPSKREPLHFTYEYGKSKIDHGSLLCTCHVAFDVERRGGGGPLSSLQLSGKGYLVWPIPFIIRHARTDTSTMEPREINPGIGPDSIRRKRVALNKISSLTFHAGEQTKAKRSDPIRECLFALRWSSCLSTTTSRAERCKDKGSIVNGLILQLNCSATERLASGTSPKWYNVRIWATMILDQCSGRSALVHCSLN